MVQVAAILLGFMLSFFNKWLFWDSNNNNKNKNEKELEKIEYYVIASGFFSELFLAVSIIVGLFPENSTYNYIRIFLIIGIVFLLTAIILAIICEIRYIKKNK